MELSAEVKGGGTQRDHLKFRRPDDPRLIPYVPTDYEYAIMCAFWAMHSDRVMYMNGPGPIPLMAFDAYCRLYEDRLNTEEIQLIRRLDRTYLDTVIQLNKQDQ